MEYKRFTTKDKDGNWQVWEDDYSHPFEALQVAIDRLAELEDKIEQGTLIELPCKVGDTVYIVCDWDINEVVKGVVTEIEYTVNAKGDYYRIYADHEYIFSKTNPNVVKHRYIFTAKEIFLTREEAEKRLRELQGDKE